jgi:tetratricopeptide (TPR) repeat protein
LYQALLHGIENYQQLGHRLIRLAEQAHAFRQFDQLKEMALMLSNLPIKNYQAIGHYFLAVATHRVANGDTDTARRLFELAVDSAPDAYKAKATLALGSLSLRRKDFDAALYYYQETIKAGKLSATSLHAIKAISVIKAIEGSHVQAVKDLESILPVMKYAPAHIYFDLLNSYAVELGEVGRKHEARNIMRVVLASPFARVYPEWRETAEDLKLSRRSFMAVATSQYNVLAMPEREPSKQGAVETKPAQVLDLAKWKKKMVKEKNNEPDENIDAMDRKDLLVKLLELTTKDDVDEEKLRKIVKHAVEIMTGKKNDPNNPAS